MLRGEDDIQERERFIVLLRRGIGEDTSPDTADEAQGLSAEGHARMKQIARGIEQSFPRAGAIYTSPLLPATQTAQWVSKAYRQRITVNTSDALAPGATTAQFLELIASLADRRTIVVGHEPNLSENLIALVGLGESRAIELKRGGCYGVRIRADGSAGLEWMLPPRILRKLGE
jgi:phosphohistidine phosphatase